MLQGKERMQQLLRKEKNRYNTIKESLSLVNLRLRYNRLDRKVFAATNNSLVEHIMPRFLGLI